MVELPDLETKSIAEVEKQLAASFGDGDITIRPNKKEKSLTVEVSLTDGTQFTGEIKVNPNAGAEVSEEQEITLKFVPFPVCMPGDKELVWLLAKHLADPGPALRLSLHRSWHSRIHVEASGVTSGIVNFNRQRNENGSLRASYPPSKG